MDINKAISVRNNKIYILILTYNNWRDTIECLESVVGNSYPVYQVVCVDNASTDGSEQKIKEWADGSRTVSSKILQFSRANKPISYITYDKTSAEKGGDPEREKKILLEVGAYPLVYIRVDTNLGYGGGNNVGMRYILKKADGIYIWILNNDTVVDKNAISKLVSYVEKAKRIGMAGSKLLYYDKPDILQAAGGGEISPWVGNARLIGNNEQDSGKWDRPLQLDYICGASLFIKREVLEDIGLLDEQYFLYWEDVDWGMEARRKHYSLMYCPESKVWHKEGGTTGGSTQLADYYWVRNGLLFIKKFYPVLLPFIPFSYFMKYTIVRVIEKQPLHFGSFLSGIGDFLMGKKGKRMTLT
jgi:GT2 family glycosyltransferase